MKSRCHRGFLMIELLFVLGMLGVFALITTRLFYSSFGILNRSGSAQRDAMRFANATAALRRDVNDCDQAKVISAGELDMTDVDGSSLRWTAAADGLLRTSATDQRHWTLGEPVSFAGRGELVLLCSGKAGDATAASIPFASQRRILETGGAK